MQHHHPFQWTALGFVLSGWVTFACGATTTASRDETASGGVGAGARGGDTSASGGVWSGDAGGAASGDGGTPTGGRASGGTPTGGTATGGLSSGGGPGIAGAPTGGAVTGGADTGGADTGGANTGGVDRGGADTGGAVTAGAGAFTGGAGGTGGSDCPTSPPADGSPCTPPWEPSGGTFGQIVSAHCSWGEDPRPACRTRALCENGIWQVTTPDCGELLPPECSSSPPEAHNTCADTSSSCWYDDGTRCWCSECVGGSPYPSCQLADPPEWACSKPTAECNPPPQAGSACTDERANCGLDCSAPLRCQGGRWQWLYCQTCCPICAAPNTPIATPEGEKPIASLAVGDLVYSVDAGAIRAVPLTQVGHTQVVHHRVMRVVLENGRVLEISPGHPTADGRRFGDLTPGSLLDERHRVVGAQIVPYRYEATYDILPGSSTGTYFAAGALVGSTLGTHRSSTAE